MTPSDLLECAVEPAMAMLKRLTRIDSDERALVLIMAIAGQESSWTARLQHGGPARSFWQFEGPSGGVGELFLATRVPLSLVCAELLVPFTESQVFEAMAWNDWLGACMCRLLLWQDPAALPVVGDEEAGWTYYSRNWRPGAPDRHRWSEVYTRAIQLVRA